MAIRNETIEAFFKAYAARMNNALGDHPKDDVDGTVNSFADYFVESSPVGVSGGKNDAAFRSKIPQGNAFYRSLGTQSMTIEKLDITPLDDYTPTRRFIGNQCTKSRMTARFRWNSM